MYHTVSVTNGKVSILFVNISFTRLYRRESDAHCPNKRIPVIWKYLTVAMITISINCLSLSSCVYSLDDNNGWFCLDVVQPSSPPQPPLVVVIIAHVVG